VGVRAGWERLRRGPRWVRALVVGPLVLAVYAGLGALLWSWHHRPDESLAGRVLGQVVQGVVVLAVVVLLSRWSGGYEASTAAARAIREQRIPDGADPRLLRRGLEGFRRVQSRLLPWLTAVLLLTTAAVAVLAVVQGQPDLLWVGGASAALTVGYPVLIRNRLGRVDRLLAELDGRAPG
jgi:hypothetical protein